MYQVADAETEVLGTRNLADVILDLLGRTDSPAWEGLTVDERRLFEHYGKEALPLFTVLKIMPEVFEFSEMEMDEAAFAKPMDLERWWDRFLDALTQNVIDYPKTGGRMLERYMLRQADEQQAKEDGQ
jgi:hypothetical protein